jgi:hypothetical protein
MSAEAFRLYLLILEEQGKFQDCLDLLARDQSEIRFPFYCIMLLVGIFPWI